MLEKASEMAKRADGGLPALFRTLPRLTYNVRPVPLDIEDNYTTGRYNGGSLEEGVPGGYIVNTGKLDQRPLYELPALTLHEAVPGHHIQIALQQEAAAGPAFRRNAGVTAFTEGWGLYSEFLGEEMGFYRTPEERFGRLSLRDVARLPSGRRHRHALDGLDHRTGPRLFHRQLRPVAAQHRDRAAALHRLAGPGPGLQDRRDPPARHPHAGRDRRWASGSTSATSTTPCWSTAPCRWTCSTAAWTPGSRLKQQ